MPTNGTQLWRAPHPPLARRAGDDACRRAGPPRARTATSAGRSRWSTGPSRCSAAFDAGHRSLSLGELSRRSGIPTSSTLRLAGRLMAWGALERAPTAGSPIGLRLWEVASLAPRGQGLKQVALPFMGDLEEVTRQHVLLAVRDGDDALLVERLSAHQAMPVLYRVGGRLPLHSTGSAWCCSPSPSPPSRRRCSPSR